jgi:putative membrane protein
MVAFWGLIIWAVWYFVTGANRRPDPDRTSPGDAKRILDERLARGEIDTDEYRRLLAVIRGDSVGAGTPPERMTTCVVCAASRGRCAACST